MRLLGAMLGRLLSERRARWLVLAAGAALVVEPVLVAAAVVCARYGRLRLSVFFAREELAAALFAPFQNPVLHANILYINFLKGEQNAEMYLYTVEALLLSALIGVLMGLNLGAWLFVRKARRISTCPSGTGGMSWTGLLGGGSGGVGTVLGAAAGAAGCCGFSVGGGGILVGLGLSYSTATALGSRSELLQLLAAGILLFNLWYVAQAHRHLLDVQPA